MDPFELKKDLESKGFYTEIHAGYYGKGRNILKSGITCLINCTISLLGKVGLKIAPFYAIHAVIIMDSCIEVNKIK